MKGFHMLTRVVWFLAGLTLAAVPGLLFGLGMVHANRGAESAAAALEAVRGEYAALARADAALALLDSSAVEADGERDALEAERFAALSRASVAVQSADADAARSRIGLWAWIGGLGSALAAVPVALLGLGLALTFDLRASMRRGSVA